MNKKRVFIVGVTLGIGFLVACGFVLGQSSVRVVQDSTPPAPKPTQAPDALPPVQQPAAVVSTPATEQKSATSVSEAPIPNEKSNVVPPPGVQLGATAPQTGEPVAEASVQNGNPTGRQEPAVSLEWVGPPTVKLGQPTRFQIVLKNVSSALLHNATVRSRVPPSVTLKGSEPKAAMDGDMLSWELGELGPQQERRIDLIIVPDSKGRCSCTAVVTFSSSSSVQLQVQEPKLLLKATGPDKVLLGDPGTTSLTVTNPGDGTAEHVRVKALLSDGLEHSRGRDIDFDLGNLGPNESRSVEVVCQTKVAGEQKVDAVATAEGNLSSRDSAIFAVMQPKLELAVNGPGLRYLERQGTYSFRVTNTGNAPASNVTVTEQIPQGFKFVSASGGGRQDFTTRTVCWFLGDVPPNQSREVSLQVLAVNIGEFKHIATARAARGLEAAAEAETRVEGLSALQFELIDLEDPVEVGANCRYEIRVTNTGSKTETNIQVSCTMPDKLEFWGAQGAGNSHHRIEGKEVVFEALPKLPPRADAVYRIQCKAVAPGDIRFKARIKADSLEEPVNKEESTRVYADQANKPNK
ncbi:MAG TPA: hypothetical protein VGY66_12625 [Gemmataceae bacterium]|jgi:uncharacterized repeat protein (TIGR01451 family)|nr:hypothetical protein [Gemmataceae bacterium]